MRIIVLFKMVLPVLAVWVGLFVPMSTAAAEWKWEQAEGQSLALVGENGLVWRLNYGEELQHFYFDPLCTGEGVNTTWVSPPDHIWHYGLWFSWKYVNKINYWEIPKRGDGYPKGRTRIDRVDVLETTDASAQVRIHQSLIPSKGADPVAEEVVLLTIETPRSDGSYAIDWQLESRALVDLKLSSPKGYAGLSFRASRDWKEPQFMNSAGKYADFSEGVWNVGNEGAWMDTSGLNEGQAVGVTFFDHPSNPRFPNQWFLVNRFHENKAGDTWPMHYNNAALLAGDGIQVKQGDSLTLTYRVYVHPGRGNQKTLNAEFEQFKAK